MIVGVGDVTNVLQYFVQVNNYGYEFATCLEALDAAVKLYFAFDCDYPSSSSSLWTFFQKAAFDISLPSDKKNTSIDVLIGRVQNKLEAQRRDR